jgi:hypothetical protein
VPAHSTAKKAQDGRESGALPAPRHTATADTSTVARMADFTCADIAWCAANPTCSPMTAASPLPNAKNAATAPRHRFQVPTVANTDA